MRLAIGRVSHSDVYNPLIGGPVATQSGAGRAQLPDGAGAVGNHNTLAHRYHSRDPDSDDAGAGTADGDPVGRESETGHPDAAVAYPTDTPDTRVTRPPGDTRWAAAYAATRPTYTQPGPSHRPGWPPW